jgi:hypothetical protein
MAAREIRALSRGERFFTNARIMQARTLNTHTHPVDTGLAIHLLQFA